MPRMRSIKPEFWADQDLTRLPREVRLLYVALWNFADEQARLQGDPRLVKSWCFPLDDDVTAAVVDDWLNVLVLYGKVVRYSVEGSLYLHLPKLPSHQKLDPRLESRLPAPSDDDVPEINTDESVRTGVENTDPPPPEVAKHVASGREHVAGSRGQGARAARIPTDWTPDSDLIAAMRAEGIPDELARRELPKFRDYWTAKSGKDATKHDWSATWRNWLRRASEDGPVRGSPGAGSTKAAGWLALETSPLQALPGGAS
jgi:DnaT-like ssDNA binding protein